MIRSIRSFVTAIEKFYKNNHLRELGAILGLIHELNHIKKYGSNNHKEKQ